MADADTNVIEMLVHENGVHIGVVERYDGTIELRHNNEYDFLGTTQTVPLGENRREAIERLQQALDALE